MTSQILILSRYLTRNEILRISEKLQQEKRENTLLTLEKKFVGHTRKMRKFIENSIEQTSLSYVKKTCIEFIFLEISLEDMDTLEVEFTV